MPTIDADRDVRDVLRRVAAREPVGAGEIRAAVAVCDLRAAAYKDVARDLRVELAHRYGYGQAA